MKRLFQNENILKLLETNEIRKENGIKAIGLIHTDEYIRTSYAFYKYEDIMVVRHLRNNSIVILNSKEDIEQYKKYFKNFLFIDEITRCEYFIDSKEGHGELSNIDDFFNYLKEEYLR